MLFLVFRNIHTGRICHVCAVTNTDSETVLGERVEQFNIGKKFDEEEEFYIREIKPSLDSNITCKADLNECIAYIMEVEEDSALAWLWNHPYQSHALYDLLVPEQKKRRQKWTKSLFLKKTYSCLNSQQLGY